MCSAKLFLVMKYTSLCFFLLKSHSKWNRTCKRVIQKKIAGEFLGDIRGGITGEILKIFSAQVRHAVKATSVDSISFFLNHSPW